MASILIVDDEPAIRKLLAMRFRNDGMAVYQAGNGLEAAEILESKPVDVMIIDIVMPEQGGIETIMQAKEVHKNLKIIAISGRVPVENDAFMNLIKQYKVEYVFDKPFDKDVIYNAAIELLENMGAL